MYKGFALSMAERKIIRKELRKLEQGTDLDLLKEGGMRDTLTAVASKLAEGCGLILQVVENLVQVCGLQLVQSSSPLGSREPHHIVEASSVPGLHIQPTTVRPETAAPLHLALVVQSASSTIS